MPLSSSPPIVSQSSVAEIECYALIDTCGGSVPCLDEITRMFRGPFSDDRRSGMFMPTPSINVNLIRQVRRTYKEGMVEGCKQRNLPIVQKLDKINQSPRQTDLIGLLLNLNRLCSVYAQKLSADGTEKG